MKLDNFQNRPMDVYFGLAFVICIYLSAVSMQLISDIPPWQEGSPLDSFTSNSLWCGSMLGFALAFRQRNVFNLRTLFWLAVCAGTAFLAIDEIFSFHERTMNITGDDDYPKYLLWIIVPFGCWLLHKLETLTIYSKLGLAVGYFFHTLYIIEETGDGDIFRLPFKIETLRYVEDFFELAFVVSYLFALMIMYTRSNQLPESERRSNSVSY